MSVELKNNGNGRIGTVLRKYRLDALVGSGGMAAVYVATHVHNGDRVAIKLLHAEVARDEVIRQRFLREGYLANLVDHDGVVRVLDDDVTDDGSVFLVMDLLEGESLAGQADRLGGRLAPEPVVAVAVKLLQVLGRAHQKNIVHRDIKPENIFVTLKGELKILDFGIAQLRDDKSPRLTETGFTFGTPAFMAPEQALGHRDQIGPHTDIWAVGATLFSLLTGRFVHEGKSPNELLVRAATVPVKSIARSIPDLPNELVTAIDCALAMEIQDRWPSADAMLGALRPLAERLFPGEPFETTTARHAGIKALARAPSAPLFSDDTDATATTEPLVPARSLADVPAEEKRSPHGSARSRVGVWLGVGGLALAVIGLAATGIHARLGAGQDASLRAAPSADLASPAVDSARAAMATASAAGPSSLAPEPSASAAAASSVPGAPLARAPKGSPMAKPTTKPTANPTANPTAIPSSARHLPSDSK